MKNKQKLEKGTLDCPLTLFFSTASAITTHFLWKDPMLNCLAFLTPSFT